MVAQKPEAAKKAETAYRHTRGFGDWGFLFEGGRRGVTFARQRLPIKPLHSMDERVVPIASRSALTVSEPIAIKRPLTWTDAVANAKAMLDAERASGTSYSTKYVGSPLAALVLRGKGWHRVVQYLLCVVSLPLSVGFARVLGFGPVAQAFLAMSTINLSLKVLVFALADPLSRDDAPVYMMLRALPPDSFGRAVSWPIPWALPSAKNAFGLRGWLVLGGWLSPVLLVAFPLLFIGLFGTLIATLWASALTTFETAVAIAFISTFSVFFICAAPTLYFSAVGKEFTRSIREFEMWPGEFSRGWEKSVLSPAHKARTTARHAQTMPSEVTEVTEVMEPWMEPDPSADTNGNSNGQDSPSAARALNATAEIDFSQVYANYALMKSALRGFNNCFRWFFFGGEFTLVLAIILGSVASYREVSACLAAPPERTEDGGAREVRAVEIFRALTVVSLLVACSIITWSLLVRAAEMTNAARTVRDRVHALCMTFAAARQFEQLDEAKRFKELVEDEMSTLGFGFAGVVVSPAFVVSIGYVALSVGTAIGSILLERTI